MGSRPLRAAQSLPVMTLFLSVLAAWLALCFLACFLRGFRS